MRKINFLKSIKSKKRNINERSTSKSKRSIKISENMERIILTVKETMDMEATITMEDGSR